MIDETDRTEYQDEIVESYGKRIMIGARQSGKTETAVQDAVERFKQDYRVGFIAPNQRMTIEAGDRVKEALDNEITTKSYVDSRTGVGRIEFMSGYGLTYKEIEHHEFDALVVDEANMVNQELLFQIDREFDRDVLLTATPRPSNNIVELWAEHSPYWTTWQVPASDVLFLNSKHLRDYRDSLSTE